ncbi:Fic/DOC family protein [Actinokineospora sp. HUAS TT18]|uniref:Fic/DOC family protein n=1 Tax=Actinokineospora sp. HUAS TT18 TaxID=3447451 RepID=UPI003F526667
MTHQDPYTDPRTGVLHNNFDIEDPATLVDIERRLSFLRDEELRIGPLAGVFDLAHLRAHHRHLFGDVYPWAGEIRRVDIAREDAPFAHWRFVEPALGDLFGKLRREDLLTGLDQPGFVARFTFFFAEVNAVHPFRDGNGRTQRAFFRHLAAHAGWRVAFAGIERADYLDGCKAAMVGELDQLTDLFAAVVEPV